jgi:hypothetical protein
MKHPLAVLALIALPGGQAAALSCMVPDPLLTFSNVNAAEESWIVLLGRLEPVAGYQIPDPMTFQGQAMPDLLPTSVGFVGMGLSAGGFDRPFGGTLLMQPVCYGPWCGGWPGAGEVLLFAELQADGSYVVPLDPCGQHLFPPPSTAQVAALTACMASGAC